MSRRERTNWWQHVEEIMTQLALVSDSDNEAPRTTTRISMMSTAELLQDPVRAEIYHRGWADRTADIIWTLQFSPLRGPLQQPPFWGPLHFQLTRGLLHFQPTRGPLHFQRTRRPLHFQPPSGLQQQSPPRGQQQPSSRRALQQQPPCIGPQQPSSRRAPQQQPPRRGPQQQPPRRGPQQQHPTPKAAMVSGPSPRIFMKPAQEPKISGAPQPLVKNGNTEAQKSRNLMNFQGMMVEEPIVVSQLRRLSVQSLPTSDLEAAMQLPGHPGTSGGEGNGPAASDQVNDVQEADIVGQLGTVHEAALRERKF